MAERSAAEPPTGGRATANQPIYKVQNQQTIDVENEDERDGESHTLKEAASPRASGTLSRQQRIKNLSRYSKKQLRRYVDYMGEARNVGAMVQSLWVSGDADEDAAEYFESFDNEWEEIMSQEGIEMLCAFLHCSPAQVSSWTRHIGARVVSDFDVWRQAMRETREPGEPFNVRAAVELYCDLVLSARQSAIEDSGCKRQPQGTPARKAGLLRVGRKAGRDDRRRNGARTRVLLKIKHSPAVCS